MYPISAYTFGTKAPKIEKDTNAHLRMERLRETQGGSMINW